MSQLVEVAENLKSLFSDVHKTFLHALVYVYNLMFAVEMSYPQLRITIDCVFVEVCGSVH